MKLWVARLERYPYDLVYGILEEVKKYEEKDSAPALSVVDAMCGGKMPRPKHEEPGPTISPKEFARDDASWNRLIANSSDPDRMRPVASSLQSG